MAYDDYDGPRMEDPSMGMGFSEKSIRLGFIRKVYSILLAQLAVTAGVVAWFTFDKGVQKFMQQNSYILTIAVVLLFVCLIAMACCENVRRTFPTNFIFLGIFTVCESLLLGTMAANFRAQEVLLALGLCGAIVFALTLFAFQTKVDFTAWGGMLLVTLLIFVIVGIVAPFWGKTANAIYAGIGALIFCLYIVYDTQMMIGGTHKYSISPEEYIFAALNLYLDVINLFMYLLVIIGISRD